MLEATPKKTHLHNDHTAKRKQTHRNGIQSTKTLNNDLPYYAWRSRRERRDQKALSDALLGVKIEEVFRRENGCYGAKRITA
ncbi:hypothetical protein J7S19_08645 [Corynebacterium pyruviciproducens]|uniref:hypothetical protein n=1 Tax=Corynebacterium pyruviciproducens TaxID=598660 RepID=UPI0024573173|nr:hypothetical protein [Corynebacterium pyruviciproducens]MDH4658670.1 hypothetical protein [Corynebacterium pyruviciproducens]